MSRFILIVLDSVGVGELPDAEEFGESFPLRIIEELERKIGTKVIGNYLASGTEIIKELGDEHVSTGYPIVVYGPELRENVDLGIRETFSDIVATVAEYFGYKFPNGTSFLNEIKHQEGE